MHSLLALAWDSVRDDACIAIELQFGDVGKLIGSGARKRSLLLTTVASGLIPCWMTSLAR